MSNGKVISLQIAGKGKCLDSNYKVNYNFIILSKIKFFLQRDSPN